MMLDKLDVSILEALQSDGRLSLREVAKQVGSTTPTVSAKVRTMTELGLIWGFHADIDAEALDEMTVLLNVPCRPSDVEPVGAALEALEEVRELYVVDGTQLHAKVTVPDIAGLQRFLERLGKIKPIDAYTYHTVTRTIRERPRALLHDDIVLTVDCYYCRKPIHEAPVKLRIDRKDHYVCCESCSMLYRQKYDKLKEGTCEGH